MKTDFSVEWCNNDTDCYIAVDYKDSEVLYWDKQEWIDDPELIYTIVSVVTRAYNDPEGLLHCLISMGLIPTKESMSVVIH
jgi:hypothetical protein